MAGQRMGLLMVLVFGLAVAAYGDSVNLITNPGFESGLAGWSAYNGASIALNTTAHTGVYSTIFYGQSGGGITYNTPLLVRPNQTYQAGFWSMAFWGLNDSGYAEKLYVDSTLAASTVHTGSWAQALNTSFNVGNTDSVTLTILGYGADTRWIDDVLFSGDTSYDAEGAYNGTIHGNGGWKILGNAQYRSSESRSDDGSGSLRVWASTFGGQEGQLVQWMNVAADTEYELSYFTSGAVSTAAYGLLITDILGNELYRSDYNTNNTNGLDDWAGHIAQFNSGSAQQIFVTFSSYTYDSVWFDDIALIPEPATVLFLAGGLFVSVMRKRLY